MMKRLSQKGMSLVEIMVVAAILGFLGLAVSTTFTDIFRMQSRISGNDEANEFAASVGRFLFSESTCSEALVGKTFPVGKSEEINLPKYVGYNAGASGMTEVKKGVNIANKLQIKSLLLSDKKMPKETIMYEDAKADRYLAEITLSTESRVGSKWNQNPPRSFEFPVLVHPGTKKIIRCMSSSTTKDACTALGSELDPATGKCKPQSQCFYEGSFTTHECNGKVSCTPDPGGCADGSSCGTRSFCKDGSVCGSNGSCADGKACGSPQSNVCKNGKKCEEGTTCPSTPSDCPPNVPNPISRGISCPSGNGTKSKTGESNWSFTVSCGKKCSQTIEVQAKYFICLKCQ